MCGHTSSLVPSTTTPGGSLIALRQVAAMLRLGKLTNTNPLCLTHFLRHKVNTY
jgi:hypothetical protein